MSTTSIIALVLSGYLLIGAEVFIPGGIAGFLGTVLVVAGIFLFGRAGR